MAHSTEVSPHQIEKGLSALWDTLEKKGKCRASLFNLILYTRSDERMGYFRKLAQKIIEKYPSRVLFVIVNPEKEPSSVETRISVLSGTDPQADFACDFIEITVGKKAEPIVPFLILPELLSDLPIYLVWTQDISQEGALPKKLEKMAHRLILDSEATAHLPSFAKAALKHFEEGGCEIADLNWARMESWRDLLASTFSSEEHLDNVHKTQTIAITYNGTHSPVFSHTQIQAIYLKSWLASRLGWRFQGCDQKESLLTFHYLRDTLPITISLIPKEHPELSPGTISSMTLHTVDGVEYLLKRDLESPHQISLEITTPHECYLPSRFVFSKGEAGGSLVKEVSHKGTSEHYLGVLKLIAAMDGLCI